MKITLVIPTFVQGGMERVMSELANYWSNEGLNIDIIFLVNHEPFFEINKKVNSIAMPEFTYSKSSISKIVYSLRLILFLRRKVRKIKPDVILSFGEGYNSFVLLSTLGLKADVYVSNRSNPLKRQNFLLSTYERILYPRAKGILAQTSLAKKILYNKLKHENIFVVPNPTKVIPRIECKKENIILNVGRLVPEKNQLTLITVFNQVRYEDWQLHIVGDGPLKGALEEEINTLGLQNSVKLLGAKKNLSKYYSRARIFALTSISEGYPNALCEAMAFPLACISFDCNAGPRDIIKNGTNGFLIKEGDIYEYANKLQMMMKSDELQKKFTSESIKLREVHSTQIIANRILNAFTSSKNF
ncbi:hypothetical protein C900_00158 [Fulvivirga imtechensis AK7]|uniref:Glycosyltransferase n=1 Tax=Fulvivirga imtechensis AK7 TaxID=1237149 RepID=L8JMM1_9BACT|nr:glycosyltransferase family 4 protein [Fulvivirga imtechensis]ELR68647.1 hypothetical protein C900_00158 [Fulvivirga imtechensis AK7]